MKDGVESDVTLDKSDYRCKRITEGPFQLRGLEELQETSASKIVTGRNKEVEFILEAKS